MGEAITEIPKNDTYQHWMDVIYARKCEFRDATFFATIPERISNSKYVIRFLIETKKGEHGLDPGIYVETDIHEDEFAADEMNLFPLISDYVTQQMKRPSKEQLVRGNNNIDFDIGNALELVKAMLTDDDRIVLQLVPVEKKVVEKTVQAVITGQVKGYTISH
jgi:hypothetical protein